MSCHCDPRYVVLSRGMTCGCGGRSAARPPKVLIGEQALEKAVAQSNINLFPQDITPPFETPQSYDPSHVYITAGITLRIMSYGRARGSRASIKRLRHVCSER